MKELLYDNIIKMNKFAFDHADTQKESSTEYESQNGASQVKYMRMDRFRGKLLPWQHVNDARQMNFKKLLKMEDN